MPLEVTSSPVGLTGVTSGVYLPFEVTGTLFPSESVAVTDTCTLTPLAFPVNVGSGSNVTTPVVGSIVYVPSPSTTTLPSALAPSNEYAAVVQSTFVPSNVLSVLFNSEKRSFPDLDVCGCPCFPVVSSADGAIPYTVGVYAFSTATVTGFPDSSLNVTSAATVTGFAVPTNPSTGVNVTSPVFESTVYVPSAVVNEATFAPVFGSTSL